MNTPTPSPVKPESNNYATPESFAIKNGKRGLATPPGAPVNKRQVLMPKSFTFHEAAASVSVAPMAQVPENTRDYALYMAAGGIVDIPEEIQAVAEDYLGDSDDDN